MKEKQNDFLKDFKKWVLDAPDGVKIMRLYNRGLITLCEAVRMINNAYMDEIQLINIG